MQPLRPHVIDPGADAGRAAGRGRSDKPADGAKVGGTREIKRPPPRDKLEVGGVSPVVTVRAGSLALDPGWPPEVMRTISTPASCAAVSKTRLSAALIGMSLILAAVSADSSIVAISAARAPGREARPQPAPNRFSHFFACRRTFAGAVPP
jgi:hypothetical protein